MLCFCASRRIWVRRVLDFDAMVIPEEKSIRVDE